MAVRIQFRRGTASQWTSSNPVLSVGEFGYETDTRLFKVGDGSTSWTSLAYSASTITQITAGSGLTGGGTTGSLTLSVDNSSVVRSVTAGAGLTGGGTGGDITISLAGGSAISPSIVDAKGDLIAGTASDTVSRLAVGAANTRLVADSTQTTGLKWVADSVNTVVDAKGDILIGSADNTLGRLAASTNGYLLAVDDSQTLGVKWLDPTEIASPDNANTIIGFSCFA